MSDFKAEDEPKVDSEESHLSLTKSFPLEVQLGESELNTHENPAGSITRMLAAYGIGPKLRRLRLRKKMGLADLGKHSGLSASMLSQLENGRLIPTLPTLSRIALVFDLGLEYFLDNSQSKRVFAISHARERIRFPQNADAIRPAFFFEVLTYGAMDKRLSAYLAEFPLNEEGETCEHSHESWELVHVLSGSLSIRYDSNDHHLETGDSVYFNGLEPHSYRGRSDPPAQAVVIVTPASI
jgi:transcriptional regulator with XRE-family HTH domain